MNKSANKRFLGNFRNAQRSLFSSIFRDGNGNEFDPTAQAEAAQSASSVLLRAAVPETPLLEQVFHFCIFFSAS